MWAQPPSALCPGNSQGFTVGEKDPHQRDVSTVVTRRQVDTDRVSIVRKLWVSIASPQVLHIGPRTGLHASPHGQPHSPLMQKVERALLLWEAPDEATAGIQGANIFKRRVMRGAVHCIVVFADDDL